MEYCNQEGPAISGAQASRVLEQKVFSQTRLNHFFNEDRDFADEECVESLDFVDSDVLLLL
jgi:hypothetical protein